MSSTHLSLHYHLVFSTKERIPFIEADWRSELHSYLGGAIRTLGGVPEAVGGTADHVHLLVGLRATHTLADVLRDAKTAASRWVHQTVCVRRFSWQDGYGAFTVGASNVNAVKAYIANQERRHRRLSFKEEYVRMLEKSGVAFDERFLW